MDIRGEQQQQLHEEEFSAAGINSVPIDLIKKGEVRDNSPAYVKNSDK